MNKQEKFINDVKAWGAWCTDVHTGEKDIYIKIDVVRKLAKQLDEPQKVKVPVSIGEHIKERRLAGDNFHESLLAASSLVYEWYMDNAELYEQAWVNDFEVEEEPKYRVNIGGLYLKEPLGDTNDFTIRMTWNEEYAYQFDSWNMAREHTSEIGGTVEKV